MKRAILLVVCALFYGLTVAQIPQGFNYQAIARDGSGNILPNTSLEAMMYVQSLSTGGTIFWKELHSSVTTNSFGLFTLVVGTGVRQTESTVATFDLIDWSASPKYLKTEIYYSGSWKDMGTSQLLTVPYAMVAEDLAGSVKKLAVEGETTGMEEALFEVKNKDGQTVFAVYNEGVRVYVSNGAKAVKGGFAVGGFGTDKAESTKYLFVGKDSVRIYLDTNPLTKAVKSGFAVGGYDLTKGTIQNYLNVGPDSVRIYIDGDPETKKLKGGFAVGGYDMTKGIIQDYLDISPDSVRIYIDDTDGAGKGKKGGFAVGGFDLTKNGDASFFNVEIDTIGIINPSKNRIQWYPLKNSFLTGKVIVESKDSVGINSFASGYESKAVGDWSQALGYKAIARGYYSTAIGKNAIADNTNSFAFGEDSRALNNESYAIGRGAVASGYRSFAFGSAGIDSTGNPTDIARAIGDYSFAIGQGSKSLGRGSFAIGLGNSANGDYSISLGYGNISSADLSTAMGNYTKATGYSSTSTGFATTASGQCSFVIGKYSKAYGDCSVAIGYDTRTNGPNSLAIGQETAASGGSSIAGGYMSYANGFGSIAMGRFCGSEGLSSIAFGEKCHANMEYAIALGTFEWANGVGSTAIGNNTTADGRLSIAMGNYTQAFSGYETVFGNYNTSYSPMNQDGWDNNDRLFTIGNGTSSIARSDAFSILKNGNTGIGRNPTTNKLEVEGNASKTTAGSWLANSDSRIKTQIYEIENATETILELHPVKFKYTEEWRNRNLSIQDKFYYNFIAQEFFEVFPESVQGSGEFIEGDSNEILQLDPYNAQMVALKALQEVILQNKEQQQQIESYKSQLQTLQEKVDKIEILLAKALGE